MLVKKAISDDGSLLFPERLSREFLEEQRKSQGSYILSCQYQNEPVDDDSATFKKSWIRYYYSLPAEQLEYYITIDPAISQRRDGDYSAIIVPAVSRRNDLYVVEAIRERMTLNELKRLVAGGGFEPPTFGL